MLAVIAIPALVVVPLSRFEPGTHTSLKLAALALGTLALALLAAQRVASIWEDRALAALALFAVLSLLVAGAPLAEAVPVLAALTCLAVLPQLVRRARVPWSAVELAVIVTTLGVAGFAALELVGAELPWAPLRRPASTLGNRNHVAQYLVIALPILVGAASRRRRGAHVAVALGVAVVLVARSRGAYLALGIPLVVLAATAWRNRPPATKSVAAALGIGLALGLAPWPGVRFADTITDATSRVFESGGGTGLDRIHQHEIGFAALSDDPVRWLFGLGPGSWERARSEHAHAGSEHVPRFSGATLPNSELLRVLVEQGALGLLSLIAVLVATLHRASRARAGARANAPPAVVVASLGAAATIALFDPVLVRPECVALLGAVLGAMATARDGEDVTTRAVAVRRRQAILSAAIASAIVVACTLRTAAFLVASSRSLAAFKPGSAAWEARLDTAAALYPMPALNERRALGLAARGRCADAKHALDAFATARPFHWGARMIVARCYERAGAVGEAAKLRARVETVEPHIHTLDRIRRSRRETANLLERND